MDNVVKLFRFKGEWYMGTEDPEIVRKMGGRHTGITGYTANVPEDVVISGLQRRFPGREVRVSENK